MRSSDVSTLFASAVAMIAAALAGAIESGATLLLIAVGSLVVGGMGLLVVSAITVVLVLRRRVAAAKSAPTDLEISIATTVARTEHVESTAPTSTSQPSNRGGATGGSAELPASVAHDLRSPLVAVHSYLELLAEEAFGSISTEAREAAQRATVAAGRAQSMVEDTLRQFAVSSATLPLDAPEMSVKAMIERVDMSGLMEEVVVALEAEIASSGAELELEQLPAARGDNVALFRVFVNLIENALKYSPADATLHVTVSGGISDRRCEITVRDHGGGIFRRSER
jgi:signal transduction histidine kinase